MYSNFFLLSSVDFLFRMECET